MPVDDDEVVDDRPAPTTAYGLALRALEVIVSKGGVTALLLFAIVGSFLVGTGYTLKTVGPAAADWLNTSAETTSALKGTLVMLANNLTVLSKNLELNSERISLLEKKLEDDTALTKRLMVEGTEPAKELLKEFKDAHAKMETASESRVRSEKVLEEIRDAVIKQNSQNERKGAKS